MSGDNRSSQGAAPDLEAPGSAGKWALEGAYTGRGSPVFWGIHEAIRFTPKSYFVRQSWSTREERHDLSGVIAWFASRQDAEDARARAVSAWDAGRAAIRAAAEALNEAQERVDRLTAEIVRPAKEAVTAAERACYSAAISAALAEGRPQ